MMAKSMGADPDRKALFWLPTMEQNLSTDAASITVSGPLKSD